MTYEENLKLQLSRFINDVEDHGDDDEYYETIRVLTDFLEWSGVETDDPRLQPYEDTESDSHDDYYDDEDNYYEEEYYYDDYELDTE